MDILSVIELNPQTWPLAIMGFLRITTVFFFLPLFGDQVVPVRLRIVLGLAFTFFVFPIYFDDFVQSDNYLQWSAATLAIGSLKEVFFGFSIGYSAKMIMTAASISAHVTGINMGFQVAALFAPGLNDHETSYSVLLNWIVVMVILIFNVHYLFIQNLVESFRLVPVGMNPDSANILKLATLIITEAFSVGLKFAAPLIAIQVLIYMSLGLLNRTMPNLNVFVISFPLSFLVSVIVLYIICASFVRFISSYGMDREALWFHNMFRAFVTNIK